MTQGSSLPPLKKNDSKYVVIALLFLLGAGALWFFAKPEESPPETQVTEPPSETPAREQFVPELEIPEDQSAAKDTAPEEEPSTTPSGAMKTSMPKNHLRTRLKCSNQSVSGEEAIGNINSVMAYQAQTYNARSRNLMMVH